MAAGSHLFPSRAAGSHLFPSRTEKLSPLAPMVLPKGGRVGSRRPGPPRNRNRGGFFYVPRPSVLPSVLSRACLPPAEGTPMRPGVHSGRGCRAPKRAGVSGYSSRGEMRFFMNFLNVSLETPKCAHVSFMLVPFPSMEKTSSCLSIRMDVFV